VIGKFGPPVDFVGFLSTCRYGAAVIAERSATADLRKEEYRDEKDRCRDLPVARRRDAGAGRAGRGSGPAASSHGGWTFHYWDDAMGEVMGKLFDQPFDLLLGRRTYDIFAATGPMPAMTIPSPRRSTPRPNMSRPRRDAPLTWQNSVALHDVPPMSRG
jgi:hypothetical protein